jgi:hypothetical protein
VIADESAQQEAGELVAEHVLEPVAGRRAHVTETLQRGTVLQ